MRPIKSLLNPPCGFWKSIIKLASWQIITASSIVLALHADSDILALKDWPVEGLTAKSQLLIFTRSNTFTRLLLTLSSRPHS